MFRSGMLKIFVMVVAVTVAVFDVSATEHISAERMLVPLFGRYFIQISEPGFMDPTFGNVGPCQLVEVNSNDQLNSTEEIVATYELISENSNSRTVRPRELPFEVTRFLPNVIGVSVQE